jgi:hypothetical protein
VLGTPSAQYLVPPWQPTAVPVHPPGLDAAGFQSGKLTPFMSRAPFTWMGTTAAPIEPVE